ncbi:MAG: translation elongation factor Ts [Nitrososphaerales archaeon]
MEITAAMVKELRAQTNAGVLDCRKALENAGGDMAKAAEFLREKGLAAAAKKADRVTKEGLIGHYIHTGSKVAALVEVNCESDFVARTELFQSLIRELAMQVVAARPTYVKIEDITPEALDELKNQFRLTIDEGKTPEQAAKILDGKLGKYYEENVLLEQPYIKDESMKVKDLITQTIAKLGENIQVRRFARLEVGG